MEATGWPARRTGSFGSGAAPGRGRAAVPRPLNDSGPCSEGFPGAVTPRDSPGQDSYLVDSASSHMLVSRIKPCMSKYKQSIR